MKETREETYRKAKLFCELNHVREDTYITGKACISLMKRFADSLRPQEPVTAKTEQTLPNDYVKSDITQPIGSTTDFVIQQEKPQTAEDFVKSKLNEKTGRGITLYEHYLAHDITISIGTAVSWMKDFASQKQNKDLSPDLSPDDIANEGIKYLQEKYPNKEILQLPDVNESGEFLDFAMGLQIGYALSAQKHIPTDYYPKEFVEWIAMKINNQQMSVTFQKKYSFAGNDYTFDELFTYYKSL